MPTRHRRCFDFRSSSLETRDYKTRRAKAPTYKMFATPVGRYLCRHANGVVLIFVARHSRLQYRRAKATTYILFRSILMRL